MSNKPTKRSMKAEAIAPSRALSRFMVPACACSAVLAGAMLFGTVPALNHSLAYADGYVDGTGNNIYYGYKSDSNYSKDRIKIEVHYYSNMKDAEDDNIANQDPLGKYVHVKYTANLNSRDNSFDKWAFRPMWWYGVPAGLTDVHDINYSRFEKYTGNGNPVPSRPGLHREDENVTKHYATAKDWPSISNFYITDPSKLASMNGLKTLLGIDGKQNNGYDKTGNTAGNWADYYDATKGMQGMFIDWESAGKRFYQMTYVAELTDKAWQQRDEHPLRFGAGVYRFAGNWHIATGQTHRAPKIAESLKVKYPSLTPVAKLNALSPTEKNTVKEAITKANQQTPHFMDLLADDGIKIGEDGTATLTFKDKTTLTMPGNLLVVEDKKDNVKFPPVYPAPIGVVNPQKLSSADQQAIIQGFKDANKGKDFLTKVSDKDSDVYKFDNTKQELTITYKDGSSLTIPYSQLVYQGATIADWAPYVVPDPIEVTDPSKLSETEKKQVTDAFDKANADLDIYTAAKKDGNTPVSFDKDFKNAIITWADGSTTEIPSWQFLTKKAETPTPNPQPPTPTPTAEKEFIVEAPQNQSSVNFDPFNATQKDVNDNKKQLEAIVSQFMKNLKAKDAKNPDTSVTIKSLEFKVIDGKGVVVFHADNYKDATYPMSVFLKQIANKQTPKETEHSPQGKTQYKYKVKPIQYDGDTPTPLQQIQALKDFVKSNYGTDISNDTAASGGTYVLKKADIPVQGTSGLQFYDKDSSDGAGVATIDCTTSTDGSLTIQGYEKGNSNIKTLFTVPASELYVKKNSNIDHTLSDLKQQAKDLLKKRTDEGLTKDDLKRAGITDADTLDENAINKKNEKELRELIRKLTDAKKAERKYNPIPDIEVTDPENLSEADFKKAAEAFLKANYDGTGSLAEDKAPYTVPTSLTPKTDTALMELASDTNATGISSITYANSDFKTLIFKDKNNKQLFTVSVKYKKKVETPTPTPSPDALAQMKEDAKKLIDKNPYLTPDQKKEFKNKIDNAPDEKTIKQILKDANDKGKENKNNTSDPNVQQTINNNKNGGENKQTHELKAAQKAAQDIIDKLPHLSDEEKRAFKKNVTDATTLDDVNAALEKAKKQSELNGAKEDAKAKAQLLVFLDHGTAIGEDAALNKVLGSTSTKDADLKTLEDKIAAQGATAQDIKDALAAAQRANDINKQHAKQVTIAKLDALAQTLDDAVSKLSDADKEAVKAKVEAAKNAIEAAKTQATQANKPSDLLSALNSVDTTLKDAQQEVTTKIDAEHKENKKQNDHDADPDTFKKDKEKAKGEIDKIPDLTPDQKQKYKDKIDNSTHKGDPEAIVNQAQKHKKIENALDKINNEFKHLNNAQREAFKKIIEDSDAYDHKHEDGTTSDDIDDALANAANTDNAMARLEKLKEIADKFAKGDKYKGLQDGDDKKKAFDDASTAAGAVLDKAKGDPKDADQVNELYKDLLKAMQALDPNAHGSVLTQPLQDEINHAKALKPDDTANPKKSGDPSYKTASKDKKDAFDQALKDAEKALKEANEATADTVKPAKKPDELAAIQQKVDQALQNLQKAREELDGVNTKPLENAIAAADPTHKTDKYRNADEDKQQAYDAAIEAAQQLLDQLNGKATAPAGTLTTKDDKQHALDAALKRINDAYNALNGHFSPGFRPSYPDDSTPQVVPGTGAGDGAGTGAGTGTGAGDGAGAENGAGTGAGNGSGTDTGAGAQAGTGNAAGNSAGAGTGAGTGTGTGAGAGTDAGTGSGAGAASGAGVGTGAGAGAVDADAIKNAVQTTADATAPRNLGAMTDAQSPETSGATDAQGKHARLAKTSDAAPVGAFALMTCAAAGLLGAGALRRKVKNARHSRR